MLKLLCCERKVGLPNDAIARLGAKAKAKGGDDRTTMAAEATVTNESFMFFVRFGKLCAGKSTKINKEHSAARVCERVPQLLIQLPVLAFMLCMRPHEGCRLVVGLPATEIRHLGCARVFSSDVSDFSSSFFLSKKTILQEELGLRLSMPRTCIPWRPFA